MKRAVLYVLEFKCIQMTYKDFDIMKAKKTLSGTILHDGNAILYHLNFKSFRSWLFRIYITFSI